MVRPDRTTLPDPIAKSRVAMHRTKMEALTVPGSKNAKGSLAQPRRLLQHRLKHRRQIAWRAVDDPQHLSGRSLLLQRLARLCNQPRVLHCNDRLRGEVLQQRDLLVRERADLLAVDRDYTQERFV